MRAFFFVSTYFATDIYAKIPLIICLNALNIKAISVYLFLFFRLLFALDSVSAKNISPQDSFDAPSESVVPEAIPLLLIAQSNYKADYDSAVDAFNSNSFPEAISLFARVIANPNANKEFVNNALIGRSQAFLVMGQPALAVLDLKKVRYGTSQTPQCCLNVFRSCIIISKRLISHCTIRESRFIIW